MKAANLTKTAETRKGVYSRRRGEDWTVILMKTEKTASTKVYEEALRREEIGAKDRTTNSGNVKELPSSEALEMQVDRLGAEGWNGRAVGSCQRDGRRLLELSWRSWKDGNVSPTVDQKVQPSNTVPETQ